MLLNSKIIDLDWYYSRPNQKLKLLIRDLKLMPFVKKPHCLSETKPQRLNKISSCTKR